MLKSGYAAPSSWGAANKKESCLEEGGAKAAKTKNWTEMNWTKWLQPKAQYELNIWKLL